MTVDLYMVTWESLCKWKVLQYSVYREESCRLQCSLFRLSKWFENRMKLREKQAKAHAKPSRYCFEVDFCSFDNPSCIVPLHIVTVVGLFIYGLMNHGFLSKTFSLKNGLIFFFQTICAFKGKEIWAGPWSQKEPWLQELRSYIQMLVVTGLTASVQEIKTPIQCTSCVQVLWQSSLWLLVCLLHI